MKKNNQGFMLVEALVMSVVIIGVLVFMYIQFQNISRSYDKSFHYNTVTDLYITNELVTYLKSNNLLDGLEEGLKSDPVNYTIVNVEFDSTWSNLLTAGQVKNVLIAYESLIGLKGKRTKDLSEKFNDFINYLKVDNRSDLYRILVEFEDDTYASLIIGGETK